jgi:hypothetical protein
MQQFRDDPEHAKLLEAARLAAHAAHDIASPVLVSALSYLQPVSANLSLPLDIRDRVRQAAVRVAEAAVHLECLPAIFEAEQADRPTDGQIGPPVE